MNWMQYEPHLVETRLRELRAQAACARLAASARREPTLRHRAGALLIAAGQALIAQATETVSVTPAMAPCECDI